jgi:hypothetical protein
VGDHQNGNGMAFSDLLSAAEGFFASIRSWKEIDGSLGGKRKSKGRLHMQVSNDRFCHLEAIMNPRPVRESEETSTTGLRACQTTPQLLALAILAAGQP